MKLLALYVFCGFLATNCVVALQDETNESSDYDDLFGAAMKGVHSLFDDNSEEDSSSNDCNNSEESGSGTSMLPDLFGENSKDESTDENGYLDLADIGEFFDGTIKNLGTLGEAAVEEFVQDLENFVKMLSTDGLDNEENEDKNMEMNNANEAQEPQTNEENNSNATEATDSDQNIETGANNKVNESETAAENTAEKMENQANTKNKEEELEKETN